jgi:DedD protein
VVRSDSDKVASVNTGAPATFEAPDTTAKPATTPSAATATAAIKPAPVAAAPPPPAPPAAPAVSAGGRFLVNLGVYTDAGHASALVDKIKKLGYPAFAESTEFQGKAAQRVRVGPYADRAAAENVRLKINQAEAKVPSSVIQAADPDKPAAAVAAADVAASKPAAASLPTPAPAAPNLPANRAGGYAVQVGAFKSEEEANKVRDRLRNGGVAAFIDKSGAGDDSLWKVRAGPYADRGSAESAVATLKQKFQLPGIVKTQP